jgi:hypothetical protein
LRAACVAVIGGAFLSSSIPAGEAETMQTHPYVGL